MCSPHTSVRDHVTMRASSECDQGRPTTSFSLPTAVVNPLVPALWEAALGAYLDSITPWDFTSFSACRKALRRGSPRSERCVLPNGRMHILLLPGAGLSSLGPDTHPGRVGVHLVDFLACPPLPKGGSSVCRRLRTCMQRPISHAHMRRDPPR